MKDNIVAIGTALGQGAISIIRLSGSDVIEIANRIFIGSDLTKAESHTIKYGYISFKGEIIDEVLVSIMKAPKTFTAENIVEINCHGGIAVTNKILEIIQTDNVRLAEPGEFTKRAFLNGKIDLIKAESISDIINAKTNLAQQISAKGLTGNISREIKKLRGKVFDNMAKITVSIDYPEYEENNNLKYKDIINESIEIKKKIMEIIKNSEDGKLIREGINVSIIGSPNVGKSSILNRLLEEEKAIVTNIKGTTRDVVEGELVIKGLKFNLSDTAGIRKTKDKIEKIGVNKSFELIEKAELILYILNNNEKITSDNMKIINKIKNKNSIIVINKKDLETKIEVEKLKGHKIVEISSLYNKGIEILKEEMLNIFNMEKFIYKDLTYLSNSRQISLLKRAYDLLEEITNDEKDNVLLDMLEIDLKKVWKYLGEILGEEYEEELLNNIFSNFCLGK